MLKYAQTLFCRQLHNRQILLGAEWDKLVKHFKHVTMNTLAHC